MKHIGWVLLLLLLVSTINLNASEEVKWVSEYEKAMDLSSDTGRNILVILTAPDWCYWCIALEEQTLSDNKVQRFINTHFVPLLILETVNGNPNPQMDYFNVEGYPTVLVMNEDGQILETLGGFIVPMDLIEGATPYIE